MLKRMAAANRNLPTCSVVVATYRRPESLAQCLEALAHLDYPREHLEIIVVDDGGGIPLDPWIDSVRERLRVQTIEIEHAGQAHARNVGASRAMGELLAFTDDDCRPEPSWLRLLAEQYLENPGDGLGGHTINALERDWYAEASQFVLDIGYRKLNLDPNGARFFTTNNLVVPRQAFHELGGLDTTFSTSEDREFCARWISSGRRLRYVQNAIIWHFHKHTFASFWRQHFAYGRGAFQYHAALASRSGHRSRIEPTFHLNLAFVEPWRSGPSRALRLAPLLQVWNVANTAGFVFEWAVSRNGTRATAFGKSHSARPTEGATAQGTPAFRRRGRNAGC
jgi:GT2 family glycosyltransferase